MRSLKSPFLVLAALGLAAVGCSAGAGTGDTSNDSTGSNSGGSSGNGFTTGSGGSTGTSFSNCTDPTCIGSEPQGNCDSGLVINSADGMDGARAIGLCKVADAGSWGVISADWVRSDGLPLVGGDGGFLGDGTDLSTGKGILDHFGGGVTPREGGRMLAISSGSARNPTDPDYYDVSGDWKDSNPHGAPPGYPKEAPSCAGIQTSPTGEPYDSAGLRLKIRTPTDAKSFSFDSNFYTYEFPVYICSEYNDYFVSLMSPPPAAAIDGNIAFDSQGNNISVNAGFLQVCSPQNAGGKQFDCPLGTGDLNGTGFEDHAATGWLSTTAPIDAPGSEITLHFAIWDSGDGVLDSTALIDNFKFDQEEGVVGTTPVPQ